MSAPLNARRMVAKVAEKVENRRLVTWTATQSLAAIDDAAQHLFLMSQRALQDYELDHEDFDLQVLIAEGRAFKAPDEAQGIVSFRVPENVYEIRRIEDTTNPNFPQEIPYGKLSQKELARDSTFRGARQGFWIWKQRATVRGWIGFVGREPSRFRVWFIRRLPPLSYGHAQFGSTTFRLVFDTRDAGAGDAAPQGLVVNREFLYIGAVVEFGEVLSLGEGEGGFPAEVEAAIPDIKDQLRVVTDYQLNRDPASPHLGLYQAFLDQAMPQPLFGPGGGAGLEWTVEYALVPQVPQEHHELLALMAAVRLLEEAGNVKAIAALRPKMAELLAAFGDDVERRQTQTPDFVEVMDAHPDL